MFNFIVNPVSGTKKAIKNMQILTKFLIERNIAFCVYTANKKGAAKRIASELERFGAENIIIVGGDGTINEVLNGLENPRNIKLGIIPSGTGNDFAQMLHNKTRKGWRMETEQMRKLMGRVYVVHDFTQKMCEMDSVTLANYVMKVGVCIA